MERHPGGAEATLRLVRLAGLEPPCRIIDLGAGSGEAVRLLRSRGFEALGRLLERTPREGRHGLTSLPSSIPDRARLCKSMQNIH